MHALSLLSLLTLALSAAAYRVMEPTDTTVWMSMGTNKLRWDRVESDPVNFTAVLSNTDRKVMKNNNMIIAPQVNGADHNSLDIAPPNGGLPVGKGFRVNLVKSESDVSTIYAQSVEFEIAEGGAPASTSTMDTTMSMMTTSSTMSMSDSSTMTTGTVMNVAANPNPTSSMNMMDTPTSAGVINNVNINMGLMGLILISGFMLA